MKGMKKRVLYFLAALSIAVTSIPGTPVKAGGNGTVGRAGGGAEKPLKRHNLARPIKGQMKEITGSVGRCLWGTGIWAPWSLAGPIRSGFS